MRIRLIYSGGGNPRFYNIAMNYGFKYGAQLPDTIYGKLYFADQNWKKPNKKLYMEYIKKYKPYIATIIDWERPNQYSEIIEWGDEISEYVKKIIIIPKVRGSVNKIPKTINGKEIILGYSIPTKYGSTPVPVEEFKGWKIHLLGGSPLKQIYYFKKLHALSKIYSIDGNYFRYKAVRFCEFWNLSGKWTPDGKANIVDAPYYCFEKSCKNLASFWKQDKKTILNSFNGI